MECKQPRAMECQPADTSPVETTELSAVQDSTRSSTRSYRLRLQVRCHTAKRVTFEQPWVQPVFFASARWSSKSSISRYFNSDIILPVCFRASSLRVMESLLMGFHSSLG